MSTTRFLSHLSLSLVVGLFTACDGGGNEPSTEGTPETPPEQRDAEVLAIGGRVFSIPSPAQTALAIRKAGLAYRKDLTTPLEKADALTGKVAQAAGLGLYGADLAYVTVHRDGQKAMATMQVLEKLSAKLGLSNAFDKSLMERFRGNLGSEDSLLRFSGEAFRAADEYLKTNERDDVSALVLAGGWVGSLYLVLEDPASIKNQTLANRIGDQKNTLAGLIDLLERTDKDGSAADLITALKGLRGDFDAITIDYQYAEPVTDAAARTTYINSTSTVTIPPGTLDAITGKVRGIRNMILA
jgi:hypothetical protein